MNKKTKCRRLTELMRKHHKTALDIAKMLGRSHQTVRIWACGAREIPEHTFSLLQVMLNDTAPGDASEQAAVGSDERKDKKKNVPHHNQ